MNHRTVELSSYANYIADCEMSGEEFHSEDLLRQERLSKYPFAVMLMVSFPELDFANRWCWQCFGPADGECMQRYSEYRTCEIAKAHSHDGVWTWHFFKKTDYDFGFTEWYFAKEEHATQFLENIEHINWGEKFPK
ncbi:MAG: hypothetical protein QM811_22345 [Pirellulales bacterium]